MSLETLIDSGSADVTLMHEPSKNRNARVWLVEGYFDGSWFVLAVCASRIAADEMIRTWLDGADTAWLARCGGTRLSHLLLDEPIF